MLSPSGTKTIPMTTNVSHLFNLAIDFSSLDQDQKDADAFFRRKIPNLRNSQLVKQDTDDE